MRLLGFALASSVVVLAACSGGENKTPESATKADSTKMTGSAATPRGNVVMSKAPVTGVWHEVKMIGDAQGYRFEPANITAKVGDGIRFVVGSQPPHNVAFDPATIPAESKDQLFANGNNMTDGGSPMLLNPNETWELSLGMLKPGTYPFHCIPHLAMGMKGQITITQ